MLQTPRTVAILGGMATHKHRQGSADITVKSIHIDIAFSSSKSEIIDHSAMLRKQRTLATKKVLQGKDMSCGPWVLYILFDPVQV